MTLSKFIRPYPSLLNDPHPLLCPLPTFPLLSTIGKVGAELFESIPLFFLVQIVTSDLSMVGARPAKRR